MGPFMVIRAMKLEFFDFGGVGVGKKADPAVHYTERGWDDERRVCLGIVLGEDVVHEERIGRRDRGRGKLGTLSGSCDFGGY